ncbi:MAG: endo-1,4-beta-xylanase [Lachnospiraceae bacterium]|nr:endo-1,4-beta-xylanase [Lachnospiraceae bacterium]
MEKKTVGNGTLLTLKDAYAPYFRIGAAISGRDLHTAAHTKLLTAQFGSFTCENSMKPMFFLDQEENKKDPEKYDLSPALTFEKAVPYLEFASASGIAMRGHTLVWHNQTPKWFFHKGYNEMKPLADRDTMLKRMESYIRGVLEFTKEKYPGVIYAWDVVNEAVDEGAVRKSLWTKTVGEDYVLKAFEFARKYADPDTALFYNDYETAEEWKRDFIIKEILKPLIAKNLVDGMGMQSHLLMDHPTPEAYRTALEMYGALGLEIHVTELDMHNADPSKESMKALADRYRQFFEILLDAKKSGKANVTSVTFWNLLDEESWLTGFRRETSYPLLFRGRCEAKEAYYAVLDAAAPGSGDTEWKMEFEEGDFELTGVTPPSMIRERRNIWKDEEYDYEASYGFIPNIMTCIHNDGEKHDALLVLPGGGYCMCCSHEGELPALDFYDKGMNTFVLTYTTDITMSVPVKKQALWDVSRAVRYLRKHAAGFGIDGKKLVIMGFSAGAHVCGSLTVHFGDVEDPDPEYGKFSNRPDGTILSYPVITTGKYTHADSVRTLLGNEPSAEELEYFSLEKQVKEDTPPCFLWQTEEDALVPVENTYLFAKALREKKIPFAHYVFPKGFHGLTTASDRFFSGFSGGEYTMEQVWRAAHAVKDNKGIRVSEQRKKELIEQFFGDQDQEFPEPDTGLKDDVGLWTQLAFAWIGRLAE